MMPSSAPTVSNLGGVNHRIVISCPPMAFILLPDDRVDLVEDALPSGRNR